VSCSRAVLLTITTTHTPATDLGYLLHKFPGRVHSSELAFGRAHVLYPRADDTECTAALMLEIDSVDLARGHGDSPLAAYVSDRPYVASSFLSVAIARIYGTALAGRSKERAELALTAIPLCATISAVAPRGGERLARAMFEPLGWVVDIEHVPLDVEHPEWGPGRVMRLGLRGTATIEALLSHLYVLLPVLDDHKHYYVEPAEIDKLVRHGEGWLAQHPERELITRRYLRHQRSLVRLALAKLVPDAENVDEEAAPPLEQAIETSISLDARRRAFARETLEALGARSIADLGCGEGKLVAEVAKERWCTSVIGIDVHARSLERAAERVERLPEHARRKVTLLPGSLVYRDGRLRDLDAATCLEVIEHLEPERLDAFERALFAAARPRHVVITTPNREHNALFASLPAGRFRHPDHRFEWTRAEHEAWASGVAERRGYEVRLASIGEVHPELGPPTQASVFTRRDPS
jgi:3' terminal RNA ribose 2'-O-methyltransferase Hen1